MSIMNSDIFVFVVDGDSAYHTEISPWTKIFHFTITELQMMAV